ncbi:MAG: hypothetical protein R2749_21950 [Acidimicrobiales bacterium]
MDNARRTLAVADAIAALGRKGTPPAHRERATTVALIGVDGSGKSTLLAGLQGGAVGSGPAGPHPQDRERSQRLLDRLAERCGRDGPRRSRRSETASLMQAASWRSPRARRTCCAQCRVVLFDRHIACHLALTHLRSPAVLDEVRAVFSPFRPPDLTLFVTVTPAVAVQRLAERGGTAHAAGFLERFQGAYRRVLDGSAARWWSSTATSPPTPCSNNALAALPVGLVGRMTGPVGRMTGPGGTGGPRRRPAAVGRPVRVGP